MQAPGRPIGIPPVLAKRRNTALALALSAFFFAAAEVLINENYSEVAKDDTLSIVSITIMCLGLLLAWPAAMMGTMDMKRIRLGIIPSSLFRMTRLTWILGVLGASANSFLFVMFTLLMLTEPGPGQAREIMMTDMESLFRSALVYRKKAGDANSGYAGFSLSPSMSQTETGFYSARVLNADTLEFVGTWKEDANTYVVGKVGPDGKPFVWLFGGRFRETAQVNAATSRTE